MISNNSDSCPPPKLTLINSKQLTFKQVSNEEGTLESFESKVEDYCFEHAIAVSKIEQSEENHINSLPIKKRKQYKKRRWKGRSYGHKIIVYTGYLLQCYHFAFSLQGKPINPAKATLAKEVGICIRTLDKALKALVEMDYLAWTSGRKTWETNTYHIHEAYRGKPMKRPYGFKIPRAIYLKMQWMLKKKKFKALWNSIYEHIQDDIADHIQRINRFNTNFLRLDSKINLKTTTDPPKERKKPPNWHLFSKYNLHYRDQWAISRYSESALRQAIDDLDFYLSEGHEVRNIAAYLVSRCKAHQASHELAEGKKNMSPVDWLKGFLTSLKSKLNFITGIEERKDSRINVNFREHKTKPEKSMLNIYQKVNGCWIDKTIPLDRPDFAYFTETYLENALKTLRFTKMAENAF
jgi:hypothetical protein